MNLHKNARLTFARRLEMARQVTEGVMTYARAAERYGVSIPTVRKWTRRYENHGLAGLADWSSRPRRSPRATDARTVLQIVSLRREGIRMRRIAAEAGCSIATVSRVCAAAAERSAAD